MGILTTSDSEFVGNTTPKTMASSNPILMASNNVDLEMLNMCVKQWHAMCSSIPFLDTVCDGPIGTLVIGRFYEYEKKLVDLNDLKVKVELQEKRIDDLNYDITKANVWHGRDEAKLRDLRTTLKVIKEDAAEGGKKRPVVINNEQDKKKQKGSIDPFLVPMDMNVSSLAQASAQALVPVAAPAPKPTHCRQQKDKVKTEKGNKKGTAAASGDKAQL